MSQLLVAETLAPPTTDQQVDPPVHSLPELVTNNRSLDPHQAQYRPHHH